MKDTVFISHANPEDNYFAAWIASKLRVLGFKSWVDVEDLWAGDAFFTKIHPVIKDDSTCFIAVTSESYIQKALNQNSGVGRELNTAISVTDVKNFIIPIRIDSTDFSDFPAHYSSWNTIDFNNNWQNGLEDLVKHLEKRNVPKMLSNNDPFEIWFKAINNKNQLIEKEEGYYSNWFPVELPQFIYIHTPDCLEEQIKASAPFPFILEAKRMITFANERTILEFIPLHDSLKLETKKFVGADLIDVDKEFTLKDAERKLVRLLHVCIVSHLRNHDLSYWKKRNINYFKRSEFGDKPVSLKKRHGKGSRVLVGEKTVKINGRKRTINWHYGITPRINLHPSPHIRLNYTLVFTNEKDRGLSKSISQTLRRSVPADWFNRKWYETMLASMMRISGPFDEEYIYIPVDQDIYLKINNIPAGGIINKGYIEPE
jgi:hypothetical protein